MSQEKQFGSSLVRGKRRFRFDDLAKLAVITLNSIGGIDKTANIGRKIEESSQFIPIIEPRTDSDRIFIAPIVTQQEEVFFSHSTGGSLVNGLQVSEEGFVVGTGDIAEAVADLVDNTALNDGAGENRCNGFCEPLQTIDASDENIFDAAHLQVGDDAEPEFGTFCTISNPVPEHIPLAIKPTARTT